MLTEEQLVDLQTRLAYQEDTLSRLNDVVVAQQAELEQLRVAVRDLLRALDEGTESAAGAANAEEKPPHY